MQSISLPGPAGLHVPSSLQDTVCAMALPGSIAPPHLRHLLVAVGFM
jgi:hypothetical protein